MVTSLLFETMVVVVSVAGRSTVVTLAGVLTRAGAATVVEAGAEAPLSFATVVVVVSLAGKSVAVTLAGVFGSAAGVVLLTTVVLTVAGTVAVTVSLLFETAVTTVSLAG